VDALLSSSFLLVAVGGVFLVAVAGAGVFAFYMMRRGSGLERLDKLVGGTADEQPKDVTSAQRLDEIDAVVAQSKRGSRMARDLARADLKLRVVEFIGIKVLAAIGGGFFGAFLGRANPAALFVAALVGALLFTFLPDMYVGFRSKRRVKRFNAQLGDIITMMANALRGGYSFLQTLDMVSREAPAPSADEFRRVVQEVGLGRSTEEALQNLLRRMPSDDLDLLVTAVNIQHEVGGNLAQILDTIGHTIRERVRIKGEIQTLTAQGRISGYVITALPIFLAGYITIVNPDYMGPLFTFGFPPDAWCCMPVASLIMIGTGYWAIMKIVDIEV
jgi:tight adherence protein B